MVKLDKAFWSRWEVMFLLFIVIVSLIIAGGFASYNAISTRQNTAEIGATVKTGDAVAVDYIGMFEDGTIFDTSIRSVAENNTMYPKSLSFNIRPDYTPLNFTVGAGQMISGFDGGVVGMSVNQTRVLIIPPDEGYGYSDPALFETRSLSESVPVYEWVGNTTEFTQTFVVDPIIGTNVKNQKYGWNMTVFHVDPLTGKVLVKNNPFLGEIVRPSEGWSSTVMSIDTSANMGAGEIVIQHLLTNDVVGHKIFTDEQGRQFIITKVDTNAGTYTIDFNTEVTGKTLIFKVTIVSLTSASTSE
jgi:FKBP-type peptidyl-prolyl cis-trans isomerase 2